MQFNTPSRPDHSASFCSRYRILREIGKGSFGDAILVQSLLNRKRYICKVIDTATMTPKEFNDVKREIDILSRIQHPNIVHYEEHIEEDTTIYIIMEYADEGDLASRIKKQRKRFEVPGQVVYFSDAQILHWFLQICLGLQHLHERNILHRDLKAANIFLTTGGLVKLGDFGISTTLQNTLGFAHTVCGTPYYFSPEVCNHCPYNQKSDIWSLGVLLYELLTLRRPFQAKGLKELMKKIVTGEYDAVHPGANPNLVSLIHKCLTLHPGHRPKVSSLLQTSYLRRELREWGAGLKNFISPNRNERKAFPSVLSNTAAPLPVDYPTPPNEEEYRLSDLRNVRNLREAVQSVELSTETFDSTKENIYTTLTDSNEQERMATLEFEDDFQDKQYIVDEIEAILERNESSISLPHEMEPLENTVVAVPREAEEYSKRHLLDTLGNDCVHRARIFLQNSVRDSHPLSPKSVKIGIVRVIGEEYKELASPLLRCLLWDDYSSTMHDSV